ncbi:hypothetical protein GCM10007978_12510 [Shewanella hanedai]|uniref:Uncharacterized protein n=1 Tax=Shewanella hanedai TaxID=25 RepID=A0A553JQK3_SHEHA|nr:hypothetical protein [Shewanella hanedai]TRY14755.1 hypothetical protein FN961_08665 [Shewanella hanedai]GGI76429.1 hypothetical protein GCM10007978_12510 [Shewanella hanedai]
MPIPEINEDQAGNESDNIRTHYIKRVSFYLLFLLLIPFAYYVTASQEGLPQWVKFNQLLVECVLFGLLGGTTYCLRAVYLNRCVRNQWVPRWVMWYLLRPVVSMIMGGITYFIINIGLITLGSSGIGNTNYVFFVLAFFAGLNVDGFLKRFESQISKSTGVKVSNQSLGK